MGRTVGRKRPPAKVQFDVGRVDRFGARAAAAARPGGSPAAARAARGRAPRRHPPGSAGRRGAAAVVPRAGARARHLARPRLRVLRPAAGRGLPDVARRVGDARGRRAPAVASEPVHAPPQERIEIDFLAGVNDLTSFPRNDWSWAVRQACREATSEALGYADARGRPELRSVVAAYQRRVRGGGGRAGRRRRLRGLRAGHRPRPARARARGRGHGRRRGPGRQQRLRAAAGPRRGRARARRRARHPHGRARGHRRARRDPHAGPPVRPPGSCSGRSAGRSSSPGRASGTRS